MTAHAKTLFTVEDADRSLPLVRSIVEDVSKKWEELVRVREEYGSSSPEHDRIMRELAEYIQELKAIGCHLQDFEQGLVEFPTRIDGKEAILSWKLGEEKVLYQLVRRGQSVRRVKLEPEAETPAEEPSEN
jgi:hypothetical protein